ncbi:MAG: hypothetical protein Q8870_02460, partial [Sweet potato little leaf phytoplasma]|nr:hypothetical protein [Sweet potato little leaf phytoplasma]
NLIFLYNHLISIKPKTIKGELIKNITISSTMSPGIKVDPLSISLSKQNNLFLNIKCVERSNNQEVRIKK